jgi:hypothetical protein
VSPPNVQRDACIINENSHGQWGVKKRRAFPLKSLPLSKNKINSIILCMRVFFFKKKLINLCIAFILCVI